MSNSYPCGGTLGFLVCSTRSGIEVFPGDCHERVVMCSGVKIRAIVIEKLGKTSGD